MKILATSDLHGNVLQYEKLLNYVNNNRDIEAIFIDGDISVRRSILRDAIIEKIELQEQRKVTSTEKKIIESTKVVDKQYEWFTDTFFPLMKNCPVPIYMNMGNADYRINLNRLRDFFEKNRNIINITLLENNKLIPLKQGQEELYIYSLSNVVLSSHRNKDWENVDMKSDIKDINDFFSSNPENAKNEKHEIIFNGIKRLILLNGLRSRNVNNEMVLINEDVSLSPEDTLEEILEQIENTISPNILSKTICLMHGPPYGTPLDVIKTGEHVGSIALKNFLNKNKPLLSIHGHIHETVSVTNEFMIINDSSEKQSISISIGNVFKSSKFSFVIVDTQDLLNAKRYQI